MLITPLRRAPLAAALVAAALVAATLLTAALASAQPPPPTLKDGDILRGQFVQERHLTGFERPLRTEGRFVVVPGQGLIWHAARPFELITVVTAAGVVQSIGGTETTRLSAARLPILSRLYTVMAGALAGNWQPLEHDFVVARAAEGERVQITLTPRRPDDLAAGGMGAIQATVGRFLEQVEITKPGGDFDRLTFSAQSVSSGPLSADETAALASVAR